MPRARRYIDGPELPTTDQQTATALPLELSSIDYLTNILLISVFYPLPHRVTNINIHHHSQFLLEGRGRRGKASYYYYLVAGSLGQISLRAPSAPQGTTGDI